MMIEEQLRKYSFFNYIGGFSIRKRSKSSVETIQYTVQLLSNSGNLVLIFPQGEIQSMYRMNFEFESGLEHILKRCTNLIHIVFLANLVDYFSNPKPVIYSYILEYSESDFSIATIQNKYNEFYKQCAEMQIKIEK